MVQVPQIHQKAKQARSLKTEQKLLNAFEKLLAHKSVSDLTVTELANEAGVTTGAIYRRFADKEDVLRSAFRRFIHERMLLYNSSYPMELTDRELLESYFSNLMHFFLNNTHIMRAANHLNDIDSFDHLTQARTDTADWMAGRLRSSKLSSDKLQARCKFMLRVATATYRDTFLAGRGSVPVEQQDAAEHKDRLDRLAKRLTEMAVIYLGLADPD